MSTNFNIQDYINSGILEQYAMGFTSEDQNREILVLVKQYPELQKELRDIESSLELFGQQYSKPMPGYLKDRIMRSIEFEKTREQIGKNSGNGIIQYLLYIALPALLITCIYLWNQENDRQNEIRQQSIILAGLQEKIKNDSLSLVDCTTQLDVLRNKSQQRILLKGTNNSPQSFAAVYYDTVAQRIYLDVLELPEIPAHKQYQLWAIVSGKPVDLGVFDLSKNKTAFKEIKFVQDAQAFAITLEPYGGQASPSMDQMYVMGGI